MLNDVKPWWETADKPQYANWWEEAAAKEKEQKEALRCKQLEELKRAAQHPIVRFFSDLRKVLEN